MSPFNLHFHFIFSPIGGVCTYDLMGEFNPAGFQVFHGVHHIHRFGGLRADWVSTVVYPMPFAFPHSLIAWWQS
jgi:hypothetical protein